MCVLELVPRVLLDLEEGGREADDVSVKGRRRRRVGRLDDVLEARVLQQQLRQHLLQDLHPVPEVGEAVHDAEAHSTRKHITAGVRRVAVL